MKKYSKPKLTRHPIEANLNLLMMSGEPASEPSYISPSKESSPKHESEKNPFQESHPFEIHE